MNPADANIVQMLAAAPEAAPPVAGDTERAAFIRLLDAADRYNGVHSQSKQPMARMQGDLILAVMNAYRVLGIGRTEKQPPLSPPSSIAEDRMRSELIATQAMLETIDRTNSTNMREVRERIVAIRSALASVTATAHVDGDGVHAAHCNQGEYVGVCKYGDDNCPVLAASRLSGREMGDA